MDQVQELWQSLKHESMGFGAADHEAGVTQFRPLGFPAILLAWFMQRSYLTLDKFKMLITKSPPWQGTISERNSLAVSLLTTYQPHRPLDRCGHMHFHNAWVLLMVPA